MADGKCDSFQKSPFIAKKSIPVHNDKSLRGIWNSRLRGTQREDDDLKKMLMGNEAIAFGAVRAGVAVCAGYPGTPSSEIMETIAREKPDGVYAEWSVNEKSALEVAAGAAIAGARALVTMKQVGLNVASDPLMSLNYVGVKAGLVIVACDDPGPISSQTEQDTRHFGRFAKITVFDPASPEEAYAMACDAFALSERIGRPVILRPTTRVCHSYATVELLPDLPRRAPEGFTKDGGRWVIFPKLTYANHLKIEVTLNALAGTFSGYPGNRIEGNPEGSGKEETRKIGGADGRKGLGPYFPKGQGRKGVATGGVSYLYVKEALGNLGLANVTSAGTMPEAASGAGGAAGARLLKIGTYPFPADLCYAFLDGLDEVLVCEELDPCIEDELVRLCGQRGIPAVIRGKRSGDMPNAGENSVEAIERALRAFLGAGIAGPAADLGSGSTGAGAAASDSASAPTSSGAPPILTASDSAPPLPARPPVLCAGCPHRASFFAVKEEMKGKRAVYSGDIGCYTLGNAMPLDMVDTCLCMGAGITQAQGLFRAEPDALHFAFIGDSTFFHTGIPGVVNAVYNGNDVIIAILDNGTTAMTGGQRHPGMDRTLMGAPANPVSIRKLIDAIGVSDVQCVSAFDLEAAKAAVARAASANGVRVILFEGLCVNVAEKGAPIAVDTAKCTGCGVCVSKLGCPALSLPADNPADNPKEARPPAEAPAGEGMRQTGGADEHKGPDQRSPGEAHSPKTITVDSVLCTGCGLCAQVCPFGAFIGNGGDA
jgi:indolepyruvate ferredoxin oxidoreductase alpha subunit